MSVYDYDGYHVRLLSCFSGYDGIHVRQANVYSSLMVIVYKLFLMPKYRQQF